VSDQQSPQLLEPRIDRGHAARLCAELGLDAPRELDKEPGQRFAIDPRLAREGPNQRF
jgi:hypothetical protein